MRLRWVLWCSQCSDLGMKDVQWTAGACVSFLAPGQVGWPEVGGFTHCGETSWIYSSFAICFGWCTTEINIPVLLNLLWYVCKRYYLSQSSLPLNRSVSFGTTSAHFLTFPWQVIPTLSFILPLLVNITLTQNISCANDTTHLMWGLMQEAKWGLL